MTPSTVVEVRAHGTRRRLVLVQDGQVRLVGPTEGVRLLPTLAQSLGDGSPSGLRARGGLTVDATWKDSKFTSYRLKGRGAKRATVTYGAPLAPGCVTVRG